MFDMQQLEQDGVPMFRPKWLRLPVRRKGERRWAHPHSARSGNSHIPVAKSNDFSTHQIWKE